MPPFARPGHPSSRRAALSRLLPRVPLNPAAPTVVFTGGSQRPTSASPIYNHPPSRGFDSWSAPRVSPTLRPWVSRPQSRSSARARRGRVMRLRPLALRAGVLRVVRHRLAGRGGWCVCPGLSGGFWVRALGCRSFLRKPASGAGRALWNFEGQSGDRRSPRLPLHLPSLPPGPGELTRLERR